MTKKSIAEFEKEKGLIFKNIKDDSKKITEDEFNKMIEDINSWVGVDYALRLAFLKDNGYEVNRENLINSSLSVRQDINV